MTSSPLAVKVEITPLTPGIIDSFAKLFLFRISGLIVLTHPSVLQRLTSRKVQYILSSLPLRVSLISVTGACLRLRECVLWKMRDAHFPQYTLPLLRGEAARAPGEDAENQTRP